MSPVLVPMLLILAEFGSASCPPSPVLLKIIRESDGVRLVRLGSRAERSLNPLDRGTTFIGFPTRSGETLSAETAKMVARAFGQSKSYSCVLPASNPEIQAPLQFGFEVVSSDGRVRLVVLEPERRIQLHLATGSFTEAFLSPEGVIAWERALAALVAERGGDRGLFLALHGTKADSVPPAPLDTAQILDLTAQPHPEAVYRAQAEYPQLAREAGVDGTVLVDALIRRDGTVEKANVVKSIPMLDGAALEAVRQWRFRPILRGGTVLRAWVRIPVKFSLH